ncbi:MurE [Acrasis kona]|uniref:MurE n=1 Tax=Acrasis kona TaxID=1008807 RepID=A0AAW2ZRI5_9EUKA
MRIILRATPVIYRSVRAPIINSSFRVNQFNTYFKQTLALRQTSNPEVREEPESEDPADMVKSVSLGQAIQELKEQLKGAKGVTTIVEGKDKDNIVIFSNSDWNEKKYPIPDYYKGWKIEHSKGMVGMFTF